MGTTPQKTYGSIVGPSVNLMGTLHGLGIWGTPTLTLASESDGQKFENAITGCGIKIDMEHAAFDPTTGQVAQRSILLGGITFVWPVEEPPPTE